MGGVVGISQGRAPFFAALWCCMWGRGQRGNNATYLALAHFQLLPLLPTSNLGPSSVDSWVCGFVYILGPCWSIQGTLLWGWEFLLPPQAPQVFSVRGFEALFPHAGTLGCVVCLASQLILPVYLHANVGLPVPPAATSPTSSSSHNLQVLCTPPASLDECFFFNSLVVRLPYSWIFCQFWLFFVFKFVVLLLVVQGGKVYLLTLPSSGLFSFCLKSSFSALQF